jgi:hypothetical protein
MSTHTEQKRLTAPDIRAKKGGEPIVALTSYHAHTARILDRHCDVILVGDSLGMVMHGFESTVPVTLDMMILQGHAVMRGSKRALVVVDLPFGSYEASKEQAFMSAARVLKETGCGAIKLEGGMRSGAFAPRGATPPIGPRSKRMPARSSLRGRFRWCWRPCPSRSRPALPRISRSRLSVSAPVQPVTARFSCWKIC